jgi:hypothetical protein
VVPSTVSPIFLAGILVAIILSEKKKLDSVSLIDDVAGQIKK